MNIRQLRYFAAVFFGVVLLSSSLREARAIIYSGTPDLPLTVSLVTAGGGPADFQAGTAVKFLAGPAFEGEVARLNGMFGKANVDRSLEMFTYAVNDTLKVVTREKIALPAPAPPPTDAAALRTALYAAGNTPSGKWDVGYFLEHLITHPIHHEIMDDMDAKFGKAANAKFHVVLTQLMKDLAKVS